ncbi:hypothetical protein ['Catharanthus roseus' aster yellows phytoplasma]|uniref:ECF transporter S component n=3 Tax=Candidatus Phytoplasma TaxID=33926 RepID=A0A4P6MAV9_9MOLU|nr:hypothetical protein ['Catharanthus roseus' aster yellows phytoplasma]QBF23980.1 hypothetical protein EXT02_02175 ['Catharanthus roseus' aster yellows phytoplasma]
MNNNFNRNQKLLRQIILTSFLTSLSIVLSKILQIIFPDKTTSFPGFHFINIDVNILVYVRFLPLIVMSFYVPWHLSCLGACLAETIGYFVGYGYEFGYQFELIANLACVLSFGLLPGLLLRPQDNFLKMYFVVVLLSALYQTLYWYVMLKWWWTAEINIFSQDITIQQIATTMVNKGLFIALPLVFVTSFFVVILLKELFKRLQFLADTYEFYKK